MREDHRVIKEERLLLVPCNEVERKVIDQLRAILATRKILLDPVEFQSRIRITRRPARLLPQAGLIEAEVLRGVLFIPELPLATDRRCIAAGFQQMRESGLGARQDAETEVVAHIVTTRHQLHSRGRTKRLHVALLETHPGGS